MEPVVPFDARAAGRLTTRWSVAWLVAANVVGVLLAAELVWPGLGDALAPLTYGRWMPLHMNWQLYGWCALPLVGVLLAWCVDERHPRAKRHVTAALGAWSLALILGGVSWLGGVTSGKLFLDWHGWARAVLPAAMVVLWTVCAAHAWWRRGQGAADYLRAAMLGGLLFVPGLLYWTAGRDVYPAVNPDSGGATGASLLGSTLGLVMIFGLLPVMLRVKKLSEAWRTDWFWILLAGSCAVFAVIDHGNASHHSAGQILGLGLLVVWVPLAAVYFRLFAWTASARRWLLAAFVWWLLLVVTGWLTFLPGLSERLKFTNALVAHAHLAMAGLVTSLNFVILRQLSPAGEPRGNFVLWQAACAVHVAVLLAMGWRERDYAGELFRGENWTQAGYAIRLAAGAAMTVASVRWLKEKPLSS
jgi:cytochrome c oxidase cbb3-type subunit I